MKKSLCIAYLAILIALCLFFSVGALFFRPNADAEGRELTQLPSPWGEDGQFNFDFTAELETVFAERFALRSELVTANNLLKSLLGTGTDQVIVGRAGYLFFGETLADYTGEHPMTDDEINAAADSLAAMAAYANAYGADFLFAAAPNKNTVLGDYMPARYSANAGTRDLDRLHAALDARSVPYVDLRAALVGPDGTADGLYHKRDTHWNGEGARLAYDAILDALGQAHDDFAAAERRLTHDFPGDLDALLTPTLARLDDNIVYTLPAYTHTGNYATPMDLIINTTSATAPVRRALIFRDSFGSAMIPYFSASFAEVRYERANPYRIDGLEKTPADVVIVEIAERNLRDLIGADERIAP